MAVTGLQKLTVAAVLVLCAALILPKILLRRDNTEEQAPGRFPPMMHRHVISNPAAQRSVGVRGHPEVRGAGTGNGGPGAGSGPGGKSNLAAQIIPVYGFGILLYIMYILFKITSKGSKPTQSRFQSLKSENAKRKISDFELSQLQQRLMETELVMETLVNNTEVDNDIPPCVSVDQEQSLLKQLTAITQAMKNNKIIKDFTEEREEEKDFCDEFDPFWSHWDCYCGEGNEGLGEREEWSREPKEDLSGERDEIWNREKEIDEEWSRDREETVRYGEEENIRETFIQEEKSQETPVGKELKNEEKPQPSAGETSREDQQNKAEETTHLPQVLTSEKDQFCTCTEENKSQVQAVGINMEKQTSLYKEDVWINVMKVAEENCGENMEKEGGTREVLEECLPLENTEGSQRLERTEEEEEEPDNEEDLEQFITTERKKGLPSSLKGKEYSEKCAKSEEKEGSHSLPSEHPERLERLEEKEDPGNREGLEEHRRPERREVQQSVFKKARTREDSESESQHQREEHSGPLGRTEDLDSFTLKCSQEERVDNPQRKVGGKEHKKTERKVSQTNIRRRNRKRRGRRE